MKFIRTRVLCLIITSKICAVYEIMWKNMIEPDSPQVTIIYDASHCMLDI